MCPQLYKFSKNEEFIQNSSNDVRGVPKLQNKAYQWHLEVEYTNCDG